MMKVPTPKGQTEFNTFPFFHAYVDTKTVYMYNPTLPVTTDCVIKALHYARPHVLLVVSSTMELLAQTVSGITAVKRCKGVVFSGSGAPDDLGSNLVAKGVNVESLWGATEIGSLGTSFNSWFSG